MCVCVCVCVSVLRTVQIWFFFLLPCDCLACSVCGGVWRGDWGFVMNGNIGAVPGVARVCPMWHVCVQSTARTSEDSTATANRAAQLEAELAHCRRRNLELELKIQALTPPSAAPGSSGEYSQFHDE